MHTACCAPQRENKNKIFFFGFTATPVVVLRRSLHMRRINLKKISIGRRHLIWSIIGGGAVNCHPPWLQIIGLAAKKSSRPAVRLIKFAIISFAAAQQSRRLVFTWLFIRSHYALHSCGFFCATGKKLPTLVTSLIVEFLPVGYVHFSYIRPE